jgi:DNA repair protein RadC
VLLTHVANSKRVARGSVLSSPSAVKHFLVTRLADLEHEIFGVLLLTTRHHLIDFVELFRGTLDGANVAPREVVKLVLARNTAAVILVHQHPSVVKDASRADELITATIKEALALIQVRVVDHLLGGFYSVTAAVKIHQSPGFSRYQSRTKYSIDGWLHLGPDLTSNFAQARTAPRESGLAERLVARVQLRRSVMLFSYRRRCLESAGHKRT